MQAFYPHIDVAKFNLTDECPWAQHLDLYYEHEKHKKRVRKGEWKSLYSNKLFKNEVFIGELAISPRCYFDGQTILVC